MTARAFLAFIAEIRGFDRDEAKRRVAAAVDKTQLASVLEQTIETLSKGFKRRVGLAQAILHDPHVLIMDEPTDGLDPNQKHQVRKLIADMAEDKAIIVSTHILEEVEAVCTRAIDHQPRPHRRRRHGRGPDAPAALSQRRRHAVSATGRAEAVEQGAVRVLGASPRSRR